MLELPLALLKIFGCLLSCYEPIRFVGATLSPGYNITVKAVRLQKCFAADDFSGTKVPLELYDLLAHKKQTKVNRFYNETRFSYVPPLHMSNNNNQSFYCPNGTEEIKFHLKKGEKRPRQFVLPTGYLRLFDADKNITSFVPPNLYCVAGIYEESVQGTACIPNKNSTLPRIRRCTAVFPSLQVTFNILGEGANSTLNAALIPVDNLDPWDLYRDTRFPLDESQAQLPVYYHEKLKCEAKVHFFSDPAVLRRVSPIHYTDVRITENGKMEGRNSGSEKWTPMHRLMDGDEFCIDVGYVTPIADGNQAAKPEYRRIIRNCPREYRTYSALVNSYHYFILAGMVFHLVTLITYALVWSEQTIHGKIAAGYVSSMLLFFLSQYLNNLETFQFRSLGCVINGIVQHFTTISMYSWMAVMNYDVWKALSKLRPASQDKSTKQWIMYCLITYGSAGIIVLISVVLHFSYEVDAEVIVHPQYGFWVCYINFSVYNYYFLPGTIIAFVISLWFILLTCKTLLQWRKVRKNMTTSKTPGVLDNWITALKLFILTGISWGFDIAYNATHGLDDEVTIGWWLVDIYNFLQTAFLFWILVVKIEIRNQLCRKYKIVVPIFQFFEKRIEAIRRSSSRTMSQKTTSTSIKSRGSSRQEPESRLGQL